MTLPSLFSQSVKVLLLTSVLCVQVLTAKTSDSASSSVPLKAVEASGDRMLGICQASIGLVLTFGFDCFDLRDISLQDPNSRLTPLQREAQAIPRTHRILEVLTPRMHLAPPTEQEAVREIARLLQAGQARTALIRIEKFEQQFQPQNRGYGYNLHFDFLKARALAETEQTSKAIALYQKITTQHPELPEPWNNLGVLYFTNSQLDLSIDAFSMALRIDPQFQFAKKNLVEAYREKASQLENR